MTLLWTLSSLAIFDNSTPAYNIYIFFQSIASVKCFLLINSNLTNRFWFGEQVKNIMLRHFYRKIKFCVHLIFILKLSWRKLYLICKMLLKHFHKNKFNTTFYFVFFAIFLKNNKFECILYSVFIFVGFEGPYIDTNSAFLFS